MRSNKKETVTIADLEPQYVFWGKETHIEAHFVDCYQDIARESGWGSVKEIQQQVKIPALLDRFVILDLVLFHDNGTITIIEAKKHRKDRQDMLKALPQVLYYGTLIEQKYGVLPRMVILSDTISPELFEVCTRFNFPIDFMMLDGDRVISIPKAGLSKLVENG